MSMHKPSDVSYLKINRLVNLSLFISIAIVLSVFESVIPFNLAVPGLKLGISNIIILLLIPYYNLRELLLIQIIKVTTTSFILGLFSIYLFSISGAILSVLVVYVSYKLIKKINIYSLSVISAVFHNVGQLVFAIIYLNSIELIYYLPFITVFGCIMGMINGFITFKIEPDFRRLFNA